MITPLLALLLDESLHGRPTLPTVNIITDTIPHVTIYNHGFHHHADDAKLMFETLLNLLLDETDTITSDFIPPAETHRTTADMPFSDDDLSRFFQAQQDTANNSHQSILRAQFQLWKQTIVTYLGPCATVTATFEEHNAVPLYLSNPHGLPMVNLSDLAQQQYCQIEHIDAQPANCQACPVRLVNTSIVITTFLLTSKICAPQVEHGLARSSTFVALPDTLVLILHRFRRMTDADPILPEHDLAINIPTRNFDAGAALSTVLPPNEYLYDLSAYIDFIPNGESEEQGGKLI